MISSEEEVLVESVYAGIWGEASWQRFLDQLAASISHGKAALVLHDEATSAPYLAQHSTSWDAHTRRTYHDNYAEMDPLPGLLLQLPPDRGYDDTQLTRTEEFRRTEFFNDFLVPFEMGSSAGIKLADHSGRSLILGVSTPQGVIVEENIPARLTRLGPHLRRAFAYYRKASTSFSVVGPDSNLLHAIGLGLMVLRDDARVTSISQRMQDMLYATQLVKISPQGRVRFRNEDMQAALTKMLHRRSRGAGVVAFRENDVEVTLVRLNKDPLLNEFEGPTVVVTIEEITSRQSGVDLNAFAREHGLTRAEQRALAGIVAGKSIDVIAQEAFVSRETVRSQIKRLYAKTGTHSKADIIRLALQARGLKNSASS